MPLEEEEIYYCEMGWFQPHAWIQHFARKLFQ